MGSVLTTVSRCTWWQGYDAVFVAGLGVLLTMRAARVLGRLASRLADICRRNGLKTDLGALLSLCEKTRNDIRSCLGFLQFVRSADRADCSRHRSGGLSGLCRTLC